MTDGVCLEDWVPLEGVSGRSSMGVLWGAEGILGWSEARRQRGQGWKTCSRRDGMAVGTSLFTHKVLTGALRIVRKIYEELIHSGLERREI